MTIVLHDVRVALRALRGNRAYAATAILTLAIGIGATTTVASAIDVVLLRQLPYANPDQLVQVFGRFRPRANMDRMMVAPANYLDWRTGQRAFSGMAAFRTTNINAIGRKLPERLRAATVTANLFDVLGTPAALGRALDATDAVSSQPPCVISDALWRRRFDRDPSVLGGELLTSSGAFTVVGVMPPDFRFPIGWMGGVEVDLWTPLTLTPAEQANRRDTTLSVIARLAAGVSIEQAQAALDGLTAKLETAFAETNRDWGTNLMPLNDRGIDNVRPLLLLLAAAVAALLLIGCANVANLLVVRGLDRQRELTVRAALGATRPRLIRQLVAESLVLSTLGGAVGVLLAVWSTAALAAIAPVTVVPELREMHVSGRVAATAVIVSIVSALLFSILPALINSRVQLRESLADGGRHGDSRHRQRIKSLLVIGEVALTLLLVAAALSLGSTFQRYMSVDPGFEARDSVMMRVGLPAERYAKPDSWALFFNDLEQRARAMNGGAKIGFAASAPMENAGVATRYRIAGRTFDEAAAGPIGANLNRISADYLDAAGIRLLRGRAFTTGDVTGAERVALVNEAFVRRALSSGAAIGEQIVLQGDMNRSAVLADSSPPLTIVGVVADVKDFGLHLMTPPTIFVPFPQDPQRSASLVVRSLNGRTTAESDLRALLYAADPNLAPLAIRPLDAVEDAAHAFFRFSTVLLVVFAASAVLLSLVGILGVIAYTTTQQSREWAVRQALGATPRSVIVRVIGRSLRLTGIGLLMGSLAMPGVLKLLARVMKESMNVDLFAVGPAIVVECVLIMLAVGVLAATLPARRAVRIDPVDTLRNA